MEIKYPLAKETINEEDIDALCNWLKSYPRLTKGALTPQVEQKWAEFIGTRHAVFNNSGSTPTARATSVVPTRTDVYTHNAIYTLKL